MQRVTWLYVAVLPDVLGCFFALIFWGAEIIKVKVWGDPVAVPID